jgi:DNA-binding winged helix-turn-helix (wHTH) protein
VLYRFGDCEVDESLRLLRRGGREVPLQPKVLDLLLFLLRHRQRLVPKRVLFRELWPDVAVTEASLTRLVKEARRAVGDDGRRQRIIKTGHGRGYRLAAPVEVANGDGEVEEERVVELARRSLEAAVELSSLDLREQARAFAEACLRAIQAARRTAEG